MEIRKKGNLITQEFENLSKKIIGQNNNLFELRISLICFCFSLFLAAPALWIYLEDNYGGGRLLGFIMQAENPFRRDLVLINNDWSVIEYRIFVPLINKILGLRNYFVILPALFCNLLNIYLCSKIFKERTKSILLTFYSCFALSLSFFIVGPNTFWGCPDSVAFTLALIPAAFNLPNILWFLAFTSSLFVDERAVICFAFLFFYNKRLYRKDSIDLFDLKKFLVLISGFSCWRIIRFLLDKGIFLNPTSNSEWFKNNIFKALNFYSPQDGWFVWSVNIFAAFKWMYLVPIILMYLSLKFILKKGTFSFLKEYKLDLFYWLINLAIFSSWIIISISNGDVHRTISYSFFFIIESIIIICIINKKATIKIMRFICILMILTPVFFLGSNGSYQNSIPSLQIHFPLPFVLLRTIFGNFFNF